MWDNAKDKHLGITADQVRELFDYDPLDGHLRWREARQKVVKGMIAGYVSTSDGYRYVCFDYNELLAHRVIWLWVTGDWPKCQIDHYDRNRSNNRWTNLREATNSVNARNSSLRPNNSTGFRGVDIRRGKYRVRIHVGKREIVVGRFIDFEKARKARLLAERLYWYAEE